MFKTHSTENKEIILAISLFIGIVLLTIINLFVLIPTVWSAYMQKPKANVAQPIDIQAVNQAIEYINQSQ